MARPSRVFTLLFALVAIACGRRDTAFVVDEIGAADDPSQVAVKEANVLLGGPDALRVGALFAFKSKSSATEENTLRGINVAVAAVNEAGGIAGRRVEIVPLEFDGTAQDAEDAARRALTMNLVAVLGPSWSNPALAAAPILQGAGIPMIVTLATNPAITKDRPFVFRISSDDRRQAQALAGFVKDKLGGDLGYLTFVDVADTASLSLADVFADEMGARGGKEAKRVRYTDDDPDAKLQSDWRDLLANAAGAKIAFLPLKVRAVGRVMRAGRAAGFQGTFVGGDGWGNLELLAAGGRAAVGSYFASHWNPAIDLPTSVDFFERYLTANKSEPSLGAALGYDAARALFQVLAAVGTDRGKIRDALAALTDFPSTTGPLRFDDNRSAMRSVVILRVDLSRFTPEVIVAPPPEQR